MTSSTALLQNHLCAAVLLFREFNYFGIALYPVGVHERLFGMGDTMQNDLIEIMIEGSNDQTWI